MQISKQIARRKDIFLACIAIFVCINAAVISPAATYYVDAINGVDDNPGTSQSPWRTITRAQSSAVAGDTVILKSGNYGRFSDNSARSGWITYQAEQLHVPVMSISLSGSNTNVYLRFDGLHLVGPDTTAAVVLSSVNYVEVKNCDIEMTTWNIAISTNRCNNILYEGNNIHDARSGLSGYNNNYLTYRNNKIYHLADDGITGGNNHWLIQGNEIYDIDNGHAGQTWHNDGIEFYDDSGSFDDIVITGNNIYGGEMQGIMISGSGRKTNIVISNNLIHDIPTTSAYINLKSGESTSIYNNTIISGATTGSGQLHMRTNNDTVHVNAMYNNIIETFSMESDTGSVTARVVSHGNNIFGNNPVFVNGYTYPYQPNATERVSVNINALFVSSANRNYHLAAGSVAIDAGISLNAPAIDIEGTTRPQGSGYDIGAYEYASGSGQNLQPNSDAGPNQTLTDSDLNGSEQVTLNGSNSSDPDGSIVSFVWTEGGSQIATGPTPTVTLNVGQHTITLLVTDNGGLTDTDTVVITIEALASDTTPPLITYVAASENTVEILFNEALDETSATTAANYGLSNGLILNSLQLYSEYNRVVLYTSSHQQGTSYTLTVANVEDAAGNAMPLTTRGYVYSNGLAGHWAFDDTSGNGVADISGHNNTGTMLNGAQATAAGEATFAGGNDAVQVPIAGMSAGQGTIALWARQAGQSGRQYLFGHTVESWSNRIQLYLDNGYLCVGMGNTNSLQTNIQLLNAQTWYHIALSWNGTNCIVYVDGAERATGTYTELTQLNTIADIGNTGNTSSRTEGFNGLIDEVRVYNRPLTSGEIADLALVFLPIGDKTVVEGSNLNFTIRTKPGTIVELSSHNLPGAPLLTSNVFTWTPNYSNAGNYEAEFTAPNGSDTDYERINITVIDAQSLGEIGYWKFDETSGETAGDSSSSNNTGYLKNGLDWDSGVTNGAIVFSVPNDAVEVSTANFSTYSGTISMWVYVERQTMSRHYLFGHADQNLNNRIQLYLKYGSLCVGLSDSHETQTNIYTLENQRWYHVALTWSSTSYRVYVDGAARVVGAFPGLTGFADYADIGNNGIYRNKALNGKIDDVRIYNRALSSSEIAQLAGDN